jgi:hypothetical protein
MDERFGHRRPLKPGWRRPLILAGTVVAALALLAPAATAASAQPALRVALATPHDGIFRSTCLPSHVAMDDPIVHPGMPGASHQHEFFGNATTDASSTYASLHGQATSCRIAADTAAYWVPSLYAGGARVAPIRVNAYYLRARARGPVAAFPAGLKLIAGDSGATAAQSTAITGWRCAGVEAMALSPDPVACPAGSDNVLVIRFPQCWNGRDLDSLDHKSHLAYQVRGVCPTGFPVRVPQLSLNVHYRLPTASGLTLASGSIYSAHADFFNAWNQAVLARLVRTNLN